VNSKPSKTTGWAQNLNSVSLKYITDNFPTYR